MSDIRASKLISIKAQCKNSINDPRSEGNRAEERSVVKVGELMAWKWNRSRETNEIGGYFKWD